MDGSDLPEKFPAPEKGLSVPIPGFRVLVLGFRVLGLGV